MPRSAQNNPNRIKKLLDSRERLTHGWANGSYDAFLDKSLQEFSEQTTKLDQAKSQGDTQKAQVAQQGIDAIVDNFVQGLQASVAQLKPTDADAYRDIHNHLLTIKPRLAPDAQKLTEFNFSQPVDYANPLVQDEIKRKMLTLMQQKDAYKDAWRQYLQHLNQKLQLQDKSSNALQELTQGVSKGIDEGIDYQLMIADNQPASFLGKHLTRLIITMLQFCACMSNPKLRETMDPFKGKNEGTTGNKPVLLPK